MHVLLEGQTEEVVVDTTLGPYWRDQGWLPVWSIVKSKSQGGGRPAYRGGVSTWRKIENDIRLLLKDSSLQLLTTVLDYYAFPADAPGMSDRPSGDPATRVAHVEAELARYIGDPRFLPHLTLHEIETWVYAAARQLGPLSDVPGLVDILEREVRLAGGPEGVNDGAGTAPSKRLEKHWPGFSKTTEGPLAIDELGVDELRRRCPHVDGWLLEIERRLAQV